MTEYQQWKLNYAANRTHDSDDNHHINSQLFMVDRTTKEIKSHLYKDTTMRVTTITHESLSMISFFFFLTNIVKVDQRHRKISKN